MQILAMKKISLFFAITSFSIFFSITGFAAEYEIGQDNKTFVMDGKKVESLKIKAGDTIRFKNEDPFFHNIFSLSPIKTFDLGSFPKGDSRTVTFDKAGKAEIECAIHPEMYMVIEVK
jgi:plastocyanin